MSELPEISEVSEVSEVSGHRVELVEVGRLETRYPRHVGRNARLGHHGSGGPQTVVRVRTDRGAEGWGLAAGEPARADLEPLRGRRVSELIDPAAGVLVDVARPLDFALHDLAGQILGVPVHALLGGLGEPRVPCYDGAIYFDDLDPEEAPRGIDAVLANCRADHALGFRAFKLKIGRGHRWLAADAGLRRDIDVTRAVRAAYPDARLLVDANDGYRTAGRLAAYLDVVADCDLYWVEEPFPESEPQLRELRGQLRRLGAATLVADGEYQPDVGELLRLAGEGLLDVLLMDVVSFGLTAWRRLMPAVRERGVAASPHAWGRPLKTLYAAQLAAGLGNVAVVEGVPGTTDGVDTGGYQLREGVLAVPSAPGFGLSLLPGAGVFEPLW